MYESINDYIWYNVNEKRGAQIYTHLHSLKEEEDRFSKYHVHIAFDKLKLSIEMAIWYTHTLYSIAMAILCSTLAFKTHLFPPTVYHPPPFLHHFVLIFSISFIHSFSLFRFENQFTAWNSGWWRFADKHTHYLLLSIFVYCWQ